MRHIIGGYYLVEGRLHPPWASSPTLPQVFWSISACISLIYPLSAFLSWVSKSAEEVDQIQAALQLSAPAFELVTQYTDHAFDQQQLGWPNVWLDLAAARTFYKTYLAHKATVKLLGIALPEPYYEQALAAHAPQHEQEGEVGVYTMLKRRQVFDGNARGYEVLGSEAGGSFHSFACHGLETDYVEKLGLSLNSDGLITSYGDAVRARDYTNLDTTGTEPVPWFPWLVFELPLKQA